MEKKLQEQLKLVIKIAVEKSAFNGINQETISIQKQILDFIDQNFIGKEALMEKIEKIKFEEIDNGDSGIEYPTAKKSNPDALIQYAYNEAIKNILELLK